MLNPENPFSVPEHIRQEVEMFEKSYIQPSANGDLGHNTVSTASATNEDVNIKETIFS